jgi:Tfp pilus assembly protein PilX
VPLSQLSTLSSQRAPDPRRSRGFALLITLTLLAFVVLLLVGLASYTKIETAVAGNFQKQAQARQNALLALDVALAQLQKHAGPDTRVTASAESFGGSANTRHYAGVWDATASGADPVSWLVSGNEINPLARTPVSPGASTVELVGRQTTGTANAVLAPLVALTSVGVPGQAGATAATIGRYALVDR